MKPLRLTFLIVCMIGMTGCSHWHYGRPSVMDHHRATKAMRRDQAVPTASRQSKDFRHGYVAGFKDVAQGGDGTPPLLPPKRYASAKHRNPSGRAAANTWFRGFQYGAMSAERAGVGQFHHMPVSPAYLGELYSASVGVGNPHMAIATTGPVDFSGPSEAATLIPPDIPQPVVTDRATTSQPGRGFVQRRTAPLPPIVRHGGH